MKEYQNALNFWNQWSIDKPVYAVESASFGNEILDGQLKYLADNAKKILDFGCGAGWASHCIALYGKGNEILGVDQASNSVNYAEKIAQKSGIDNAKFQVCDENYLFDVPEGSFDGIFSSNVLDVIPLEVGEKIIQGFARVLRKGGRAVIMFNPYLDDEFAAKIGMELIEGNYYGKDGNLRSLNLTDEQWINILSAHFSVVSSWQFRFEGEESIPPRRLFALEKE